MRVVLSPFEVLEEGRCIKGSVRERVMTECGQFVACAREEKKQLIKEGDNMSVRQTRTQGGTASG